MWIKCLAEGQKCQASMGIEPTTLWFRGKGPIHYTTAPRSTQMLHLACLLRYEISRVCPVDSWDSKNFPFKLFHMVKQDFKIFKCHWGQYAWYKRFVNLLALYFIYLYAWLWGDKVIRLMGCLLLGQRYKDTTCVNCMFWAINIYVCMYSSEYESKWVEW